LTGITVSVVVPAWNEARRLPGLLDALARCSPAPREVIVVDGGSSDGTARIGGERARLLRSERGRARQQNAGAGIATGSVLWFLHADSTPPPDAIAQIGTALDRGAPGGCFRIAFPRAELEGRPLLRVIALGINARSRVTRTGTGDQGIYLRREHFDGIGGFPDWPLFEDVALASRLKRFGRPFISPGPLETSARRWIVHGIVRTMLRMWALRAGYLLGVSPARLARHWGPIGAA
jgi:rSAM/selenodomain-associated transferase 2